MWVNSCCDASWQCQGWNKFNRPEGMRNMDNQTANSIVGFMMVPLGLLGLLLAARAVDVEIEIFGYGLVIFAFLFGFSTIKRVYDYRDAARAIAHKEAGHG